MTCQKNDVGIMTVQAQRKSEHELTASEIVKKAIKENKEPAKAPKVDIGKAITYRFHNGLSYPQIAKIFNCNPTTVFRALEPVNALLSEGYEKPKNPGWKAKLLDGASLSLVTSIIDPENSERIRKSGVFHLAGAAEKLDKMARLERGEATSITQHSGLDVDVKILNIIGGNKQEE